MNADTETKHHLGSRVHSELTEVAVEIKNRLQADRVSVFLFDRESCELWSVVSQETRTMCLDARLGIAGHAAMTGEVLNVPDAYEHPLFYKEVDLETGYRTRNLLAVPLKNSRGEVIAVGEAVNKNQGSFSEEDARAMQNLLAPFAKSLERVPLKKPSGVAEAHGQPAEGFSTQKIVGMSHKVEAIVRLIDQIRDSPVDVLIQGENGTGKELIAKALHYSSPRASRPFVALNCAALPDNLVEAELFGIEKGVATGVERRSGKFELASGGTLFLDEIGDLSLAAQAKILRVLQERAVDRVGGGKPIPIDVRIIAATNRDLYAAIKAKQFREDLYYRIKVIHIQTPPLREIREDIPVLANHFLEKHSRAMRVDVKCFTPGAMQTLMRYHWPGNNRQLENEVRRLIASVRGKTITEEHLDPSIQHPETPEIPTSTGPTPQQTKAPAASTSAPQTLGEAVEALERRMIEDALRQCHGNKQKAAQVLGLSRQGLIKKLKRLGIG
ncbi:MAG TPA: sigma-54-dependent Fis family transcriptional regulator [Candidatus Binatia bacterium]|nr:sigma-54-dependent Fis family transcriptional regulator [Candidatus Binatia bacterium]